MKGADEWLIRRHGAKHRQPNPIANKNSIRNCIRRLVRMVQKPIGRVLWIMPRIGVIITTWKTYNVVFSFYFFLFCQSLAKWLRMRRQQSNTIGASSQHSAQIVQKFLFMHFPCIGGGGGGGDDTKQTREWRPKKKRRETQNQKPNVCSDSDAITICGNSNLLQFSVVLGEASAAATRKQFQTKLQANVFHHKWVSLWCLAADDYLHCVGLVSVRSLSLLVRTSNTGFKAKKETHFDFGRSPPSACSGSPSSVMLMMTVHWINIHAHAFAWLLYSIH